jgi:uncharacterized lipoprotein YmbA
MNPIKRIQPTRLAAAAAWAAVLLLAACASPPAERFYTLNAPPPVTPLGQGWQAPAAYSVALGPVSVPELVDRPQLVVRTSAHQVAVLEQQRWAESLKSAIPRVLAADLSGQLGGVAVATRGDGAGQNAKYRVAVDIVQFDSELNQAVTLDAVWSLRTPEGAPLQGGKAHLREATQAGGYDALVAAHERALVRLSAEIAQAVRAVEQVKP